MPTHATKFRPKAKDASTPIGGSNKLGVLLEVVALLSPFLLLLGNLVNGTKQIGRIGCLYLTKSKPLSPLHLAP